MTTTVFGKSFESQSIILDGKTTYAECTFTKCHFYYGGGDFGFVNCQVAEPTVTFTGDAQKTVAFMAMLGLVKPPQQPAQVPPAAPQMPDDGKVH